MKAVIFGAGASFDSINRFYTQPPGKPIDLFRPPLSKAILNPENDELRQILIKYEGAYQRSQSTLFTTNIEKYLTELQKEFTNTRNIESLRDYLNIKFYLQDLFNSVSSNFANVGYSNYADIVNKAHRYTTTKQESALFITFNYDTLLDNLLCSKYNEPQNSFNAYIHQRIKLIKPHGSSNWIIKLQGSAQVLKNSSMAKYFFDNPLLNSEIKELSLEVINFSELITLSTKSTFDFWEPAISVPTEGKAEFVLPETHKTKLYEELPKVNEFLIIGWRATESLFLQTMKTYVTSPDISFTIVDPNPSECISNLKTYFPSANFLDFNSVNVYDTSKLGHFEKAYGNSGPGSFTGYTILTNLNIIDHFFKI